MGTMRYGYETSNLGSYDLLKDFARQNRAEATEAEEILWRRLRGKKLGYRFRRQHPIDCYIVDFVCLELKLVVEVDGGYHETQNQQVEDQERTRILNESGYTVIRFSNEDVLQNERDVINQIALAMKRQERLNADHAPSLGGGRGRFKFPPKVSRGSSRTSRRSESGNARRVCGASAGWDRRRRGPCGGRHRR